MKRLSLDRREKDQVHEVLENWKRKNKIYSMRQNMKIPKSAISLVIDVAEFIDPSPEGNYFTDLEKWIKVVSKMDIQVNRNVLEEFSQQLLKDKELKRFSYDQFLYFLYWLRRFA